MKLVIEARHCEERSDEAIQSTRTSASAAPLDCFAASAARNDGVIDEKPLSVSRISGVIHA
jgi:hypothetical protein